MSPHNIRVPTHQSDHKCVGKKAVRMFIEALTAIGPVVEFHQGEDEPIMFESNCISKSRHCGGKSVNNLSVCSEVVVESIRRPSLEDSLSAAFNLHINALVESTPPSPLKEKLTHFMEHDWYDIVKVLKGGKIDSVEDIKSHWRQIELLVGDTNDIFLQEGALLLSLVLGETDLASDFYANVEGMEMCILEGMRDKSLPDKVKSSLPKFKTRLLQCQNEAQKVLESGMQSDERTEALVTQRANLFAQFETLVNQTPQSRYRHLFKRQGYKCLMSLQDCQRSPLKSPELAAFSRSLKALAANTGDSELFGKLFHVIYTTLRDANRSPTRQIASLLAAQCNEILSQHGDLLSPLVVEVLKAQGEAAHKLLSEFTYERTIPVSDGWLSALVDSVSSLVHKWWGANVDEEEDPSSSRGPVTATEVIASVNPALAGTIDNFLKAVRAELADVPLEAQQHVALQRLLQSEHHIVDQLKRTCKGATKSEMETEIKQIFVSHVDSIWPSIIGELDSEVCKILKKKYDDTFGVLTQTSALSSLIQRVKKLTFDPRVHALTSYILVLSSFLNGVGGAPIEETAVRQKRETIVDQQLWDQFICPAMRNGINILMFKKSYTSPALKVRDFALSDCALMDETLIVKAHSIWKALFDPFCGFWIRGYIIYANGEPSPDETLQTAGLDFACAKSFEKTFKDFHDNFIRLWCQRGSLHYGPKQWVIPISNHPSGMFTFCADSEMQHPFIYETFDEAQSEQLQCRRHVKPPVVKFHIYKDHDAAIEWKDLGVPSSLILQNATLKYTGKEDNLLFLDTGSQKWMAPCPRDVGPDQTPPEVSNTTIKPETRLRPSYILDIPSVNLAPGVQSTVNVGGTFYGLYKDTPSGREPVVNKTWRLDTTTTTTQSTTVTPSPIHNFSIPNYPPLILSNSTAVSPVTPSESAVGQHLWDAVIGISGLTTAAAVALYIYSQHRRPHIPTQTLMDQYTDQGASHPLRDMRIVGTAESQQEMLPLTTDSVTKADSSCVTKV